ncbi:MAG: hypothetical protein LH470_00495 [Lysobacter sp.]|nr:hypothetical protein [Lysobacter sp.]
MDKRFWICGIVMFLAAMLLSGVVHAVLLKPDYLALGSFYRTDADGQGYMPWMLLAHALIGFAMTWIYRQGFSAGKSNISQGLRFGLAMALFSTIPGYLIYYAVQPLPVALMIKQVVFGTISMLLLGVLLAYLQPRRVVL